MKNKDKSNTLRVIIIVLMVVIIGLLVLLFSGGVEINKKTKETLVSSKTVEEQSDLKKAISKVYDSVVYIQVESVSNRTLGGMQVSSGSGFVYKKDGKDAYILTNNHVISGANKITVTFINGKEVEATLVGSDEFTDVAVIKVNADDIVAVASLGKSEETEIGDTVFTVGAPLGKEYMGTITKGIVSGVSRMVNIRLESGSYIMETIQTDATINSGNSGGPLCNILGQVIGITSSKLIGDGVEGMGFSIPIATVNSIIDKLEAGEEIERPYLGVQLADVNNAYNLQYYYNIDISKNVKYGALLGYVEKDKPADNAGLKMGDVIIEVDGKKVEDSSHFRYELYKHKVGDTIKVKYYRGDDVKEASIKLNEKIK